MLTQPGKLCSKGKHVAGAGHMQAFACKQILHTVLLGS